MPQLVFPVRPDGLFVDVFIAPDRPTILALLAAGQPIPTPIRARGVIDTGSDITVVSTSILQQLGVPPQRQTTTQTVGGPMSVDLYKVSVGVTDFGVPGADELIEPTLLVMEMTLALPTIEVLIGLDMLMGCRFLLDGPTRQFTIEF